MSEQMEPVSLERVASHVLLPAAEELVRALDWFEHTAHLDEPAAAVTDAAAARVCAARDDARRACERAAEILRRAS